MRIAQELVFNRQWLNKLLQHPENPLQGNVAGNTYTAKIIIPHYQKKLEQHYSNIIRLNISEECRQANIPICFEHFGILIRFDNPLEVMLYNSELAINQGLCELIAQVGPVMLQNAYLNSAVRSYGHRNRFPHLRFHVDRNIGQEARYSMYTRDPFDPEQMHPRTSSTLFIPNITAHLQGIKEGTVNQAAANGATSSSLLFERENMETMIGNIILEQPWDEPTGTGEISMIDNATVLHASYYRDAQRSGYKIGVRYLSGLPAENMCG